ncbi:YwmB family TATA-box binding protein [Natranaerofaba carboxydovora]|uniref:YwmB family TATA-box binding protein n=1 Tax=Natranaerofaba carboxydovora TaxID=2742683 RepID=UPI001F134B5C|nr:YwmB family TATA-box binding protein [Natranaerofaba carboxydovora]UMZ75100.1 TATA-box binding protein [Natranaerofaba carboxydovora]
MKNFTMNLNNKLFLLIFIFLFSTQTFNVNIARMDKVENKIADIKTLNDALYKLVSTNDFTFEKSYIYISADNNSFINNNLYKIIIENSELDRDRFNFDVQNRDRIEISLNDKLLSKRKNLHKDLKNIELTLSRYKINSIYSYNVKGYINVKDNECKTKCVAKNLTEHFGLSNTNLIEKEDYTSVTGYKQNINEYIKLEDRKINLQIIVMKDNSDYDNENNRYKLIIAFPVMDKTF